MTHRPCLRHSSVGFRLTSVVVALSGVGTSLGLAGPEPTAPVGNTTAAILPLQDEITDVTVESLRRRIAVARAQGAKLIILDMDTPGGLVTSSIAVADLIRSLTDVKTVAWVNPNAHSGGALVAMACDEIVMARSSRIGDSQVIMGSPSGVTAIPKELQPKAYTPVLHDFRTSARKNGYSQALCEALVIPEREVWWLENVKTGEREFVFRDEKIKRLGEDKPSPPTSAENVDVAPPPGPEWKLVQKYHDPVLDMEVPTLQPIVHDDQLLEMSPSEAIAFGFSKGIVTDEGDLRTRYGLGTLIRLKPLWSESLALWLTSLYVRGFLLVVIFLAGYVEFHTPGLSLAGLVALIALAIFVGAPYVTGLANVWEIVLILAGLLLIGLELFVIPGFGVAGISGVMMVLTGLIATFIPDEPGRTFPQLFPALPTTIEGLKLAVVTLVSSMTASLIGMLMLSRFLPRIPIFSKLVPANPTPSQVAVEDPYIGMARVGDIGQAEGTLRPAGKARFGSMLVDVVTQGELLEANCPIEVIERRGNRVVVRALKR
jgi:membrane-bound serine protease (ClpP class)